MRVLLIALLAAISYAQTEGAGGVGQGMGGMGGAGQGMGGMGGAGQGMGGMANMMQGMGMPQNFMQYAMLDQMDVIDGEFGDMIEDMAKGMFGMDVEDLFGYGMMFANQYMNSQGSQGMPDLGGLVNGLMGGQGMGGMGGMAPYMYMDGRSAYEPAHVLF